VVLIDEERDCGYVAHEYRPTEYGPSMKIPVKGNPLIEKLMREMQPVNMYDIEAQPKEVREMWEKENIVSSMIVPLVAGGKVTGSIGFDSQNVGRLFTQSEVDFCRVVTGQLSIALESRNLFEDARRRARREEIIRRVVSRVRGNVDMESIIKTTVRELGEAMGVPKVYMRLGTEDELRITPDDGDGNGDGRTASEEGGN
jgi:GAF domain-containing protein